MNVADGSRTIPRKNLRLSQMDKRGIWPALEFCCFPSPQNPGSVYTSAKIHPTQSTQTGTFSCEAVIRSSSCTKSMQAIPQWKSALQIANLRDN